MNRCHLLRELGDINTQWSQGKKLAATGIEFHSSSGVGHISTPWAPSVLMVCAKPQRGQLKLHRGGSCVGSNDCIRRLHKTHHNATPGIEYIILASIRAYRALLWY